MLASLVASSKRHGVDPFAYLKDVLTRIAATPVSRLDQFLPDRWKAARAAPTADRFAGRHTSIPQTGFTGRLQPSSVAGHRTRAAYHGTAGGFRHFEMPSRCRYMLLGFR